MLRRSMLALTMVAGGCYPSPGPCDQTAALEVVYDASGSPAFAGQALVVQSCGNGGFCHSEGVADDDRLGAPAGLDFDLRLASTSIELEEEASGRLARNQLVMVGTANNAWWQVSSGFMPPSGEAGVTYFDQVATSYDRVADDGTTFTSLPAIDSAEGREIFRNWLACGAPVVERTHPRADELPNEAGFTAPSCVRTCVDVTWPSIYEEIIEPSCALSRCHDDDGPEAGLDLFNGPLAAHAFILDRPPEGTQCEVSGIPILTAGDPDRSLLYLKVAATSSDDVPCGGDMPESGTPLNEQQLCAMREWILCGACADPDDTRCSGCLSGARTRCSVDVARPSLCSASAGSDTCSNRLP